MKFADISHCRLYQQQLTQTLFDKPGDVVSRFGAMQAQDYLAALWAIGRRTKNCTEADVEQAILKKEIIRTWPLRGTLHFVFSEDARWMLELSKSRIDSKNAKRIKREFDLDTKIFARCKKILERELAKAKSLSRDSLYNALESAKISTGNQRGLHILSQLARDGFICFGARDGKQQTFVLLDEWIPSTKKISRDEAIAKLTQQYFISHGPATLQDFIWWSGLSPVEAKAGLETTKSKLVCEKISDQFYWMIPGTSAAKKNSSVYLLPAFDEYLIGYTDRSASLDDSVFRKKIFTPNGIFNPIVVVKGKVAGTWKRFFEKDTVSMEIKSFTPFDETLHKKISKEAIRYGNFIGKKVKTI
jgi:hypothetical protein